MHSQLVVLGGGPGGYAAAFIAADEGLDVTLVEQLHCYSDPDRDARHHTVSTVFIATATGTPRAADDAKHLDMFTADRLPEVIVFDHRLILADYFSYKSGRPLKDIFRRRL